MGTLGEIPANATESLTKVGVKGGSLAKLLDDLHSIAIRRMNQCIETDNAQNERIGYDGACEAPRGNASDENWDEVRNGTPRKRMKMETVEKPVTSKGRGRVCTPARRTKSKKRRR